jgi:hypothetical protein
MSRRFQRPAFEPDGPFVVRYGFLFNGVQLKPGDNFEHKGLRMSKLKGLYRRRKIDLTKSVGRIKDKSAKIIAAHWSTLGDKEVLKFAYKVTGTRRRNPDIARAELAMLESTGALNVWDSGGATS